MRRQQGLPDVDLASNSEPILPFNPYALRILWTVGISCAEDSRFTNVI